MTATQTERLLTTHKAIAEGIAQEMERDSRVFVMGEDVGVYGGIFGGTADLFTQFGAERVMDTPISETAFIGAATGAALEGLRPVVELMFVDFFGVCMDQIYNHMAKNIYMSGGTLKIPVVLTTAYGGGYSDAAQHSQVLYGLFAHIPGLKIVVPSNAYDAKGLMISAIRDDNPVMYFMHKGVMGLGWMTPLPEAITHVPEESYTIPFGKAAIKRSGEQVTIVTLGIMVHRAMAAAKQLEQEGISAEVIDLRTLVPLDDATIIESVKKTHRLLIVDEDYLSFGMSGEICARVVENALDYLDAPIKRLAVPDVPIPYSRPLEQFVLPNAEKIAAAARSLVQL
ncbi:alpha-ketoacid dehydrogenase subunit beta [Candidatus Chlorohelix sp.]|uniref:alpha-ketoacid dehydrogenase subunit beta n=1 Tax=Candidatus Chlorohelix sp. TaxID=3139201 RepID=UPI0030547DF7